MLPLGVLYLAAFLRREMIDLEVSIIDGQAPNLTYEELLRLTLCEEPDVVGFGYWTVQAEISQQLSNELKKKRPDVFIVHGGIHPTIFPEEALRHCDAVVMREAELTMLELLERYIQGERFSGVHGLVHPLPIKSALLPAPHPIRRAAYRLYSPTPVRETQAHLHHVLR